jgi:hypothetical protein
MDTPTLKQDADTRYAEAVERERKLRAFWVEQGQPMTTLGGSTGNTEVVHPLLAEMRAAEAHANRMAAALAEKLKRAPGRPQGAESAPDRGQVEERPGLLRAVK